MNDTLLRVLSSALKAAVLSAIIAGVAYLAHQSALMAFTISFISQFVISYFYGMYMDYKSAKDIRELAIKELEILSRITFTIKCAACKESNEVVVNPNIDNRFECAHCKAKNSVYISAESALVTVPVATNTEI
jgi:phage FluMu protein Com